MVDPDNTLIAKTLLGVIAGAGVTAVLTPVLNTWIFGTDPGSFLHVLEEGMQCSINTNLHDIYGNHFDQNFKKS